MGDRITLDASLKIKYADGTHRANWTAHVARSVYPNRGHSNSMIDPARTANNLVMVRDENTEFGWRYTTQKSDVERAVSRLLEPDDGRKVATRQSSVCMRPLVVTISRDWWDSHCPRWRDGDIGDEGRAAVRDMMSFLGQRFKQDNLPFASLHLDETTPQLQVCFVPIGSKGTLSQKEFFPNPASLRKLHSDFRKYMKDRGYDVEMESSERSHEHLSSDEYKRACDEVRRGHETVVAVASQLQSDKADFEVTFRTRSASLDKRESDLDGREADLKKREDQAAAVAKSVDAQRAQLHAAQSAWQVRKSQEEADLAEQRRTLQGDRQKLTSDREFLERQKQSWLSEKSAQEDKLERRHYDILADDATVRKNARRLSERVNPVLHSLVTIGLHVRNGTRTQAQAHDAVTRLFAEDGDVLAVCKALDSYKLVEETLAARAAQRPTPTKRPAWKAYLDEIDEPDMERVDDDFEIDF